MKYGILIFALIILTFLVMDFNARTAELNQLIAERAEISERYDAYVQTRDAYVTQIAYATSPAAAAEWAYQNNMSLADDQIVIPIQISPVTPTPSPAPVTQVTQMSNPDRWKLLIFGP